MNNDIERALRTLSANAVRYDRTERYYDGDHDLRFATEKFETAFGSLFREFALNLCPVVCDSVADKLSVAGFSVDEGSADAGERADLLWRRSRMPILSAEVHREALKNGDAYLIVWPDAAGRAVLHPNRASQAAAFFDDETSLAATLAAKCWRADDGRIRLNLFYRDRIERYVTRREQEARFPDAKEFTPVAAGPVIENPFRRVPVFHFANNAGIGVAGRSELDAAIPIQDGLNKAVLDMLVAMEFSAYRQRWAAGIEVEYDKDGKAVAPFRAGVEHLWISGDPNARFGDFESARLDQFIKVKDSFRTDIASVTGTPLFYFLQQAGTFPSGESLRQASARFIAKVRSRQLSYGQVWADAMNFALRIESGEDARLVTLWHDPSPLSEREILENLLLKKQLGLPQPQLLAEAGYGAGEPGEPF
ncbi:MAG: Phage portal protein, SPP1 Gp6-like [Acidobacteria bacterium OLB17]|nr:MAG: Phage portal protein, SPP1 Gp6-like [Acidobacteria bacterium OLB17]MCZ2390987.1 phage portal protein [Acidobacteriota bacterium]